MSIFASSDLQSGDAESPKFLLRWRGKQEGPYPASIIEEKLLANQIGFLHEIFHNGQWITIRDYIAEKESVARREREARAEEERDAKVEEQELEKRRQEEELARQEEDRLRAPPPAQPIASNEIFFLNEGGVTVTNTRFVAQSQTFALAGITSVRGVQIPPNRIGPCSFLGIGFVACWLESVNLARPTIAIAVTAVLSITAAIVWWANQSPDYSVVLTTSGGDVKAYRSSDFRFIERTINAITQAIIARG